MLLRNRSIPQQQPAGVAVTLRIIWHRILRDIWHGSNGVNSTRISRRINAPREAVYRALLDARVVSKWKVPDGMTCHVHEFDAREGGSIRISLTYDAPTGAGKTTAHTDTYHGRFV